MSVLALNLTSRCKSILEIAAARACFCMFRIFNTGRLNTMEGMQYVVRFYYQVPVDQNSIARSGLNHQFSASKPFLYMVRRWIGERKIVLDFYAKKRK